MHPFTSLAMSVTYIIFQDLDDSIDVVEFSACFSDCMLQGEPWDSHQTAEKNVFTKLDSNGSNSLTVEEFRLIFGEGTRSEL